MLEQRFNSLESAMIYSSYLNIVQEDFMCLRSKVCAKFHRLEVVVVSLSSNPFNPIHLATADRRIDRYQERCNRSFRGAHQISSIPFDIVSCVEFHFIFD